MDKQLIIGLEDYTLSQIKDCVINYITKLKESLILEDLNFSINSIIPFGSRILGNPKKTSDLDIRLEYVGLAREDDLCSALNNIKHRLYIENIAVDFFPENITRE